ncbi:hypothetical protein HMPREF9062_1180, partial [Actinomyces sp. oral taxon 448 str. F0400]
RRDERRQTAAHSQAHPRRQARHPLGGLTRPDAPGPRCTRRERAHKPRRM